MYDASKILLGLVVFLLAITFPFWFSLLNDTSGYRPELKLPEGEENCVEDVEYMRSLHMDLLNQWRDLVVREGHRVYVSTTTGTEFEMSLTGTCLGCHAEKVDFCDQCHNYVGVAPYCWDCHIEKPALAMKGK